MEGMEGHFVTGRYDVWIGPAPGVVHRVVGGCIVLLEILSVR